MIDGINRALLALLAILCIVGGTVALLAASGILTIAQPAALYERLGSAIADDPGLWWPALIGGAIIVFLLAAWWALRQAIVRRSGGVLTTVTLDTGDRGRTTVAAASVAHAAATDLRRLPQVTASSARLVDAGRGRQLRTNIDVPAEADLRSVRASTGDVYDRVATVLGVDQLSTHTRIRPVGMQSARVQ